MMRSHESFSVESKPEKPTHALGLFLWIIFAGIFLVIGEGAIAASLNSSVIEELDAKEKKTMIQQLLAEGDQYLAEKNYNLANASYESIFLLEPNHLGASGRIDRLKKQMMKEGKSETALVTRVYDAEIEGHANVYLKQAKQFIAEGKPNQARFALQKLLLINPMHEEARKLYDHLNKERHGATLWS